MNLNEALYNLELIDKEIARRKENNKLQEYNKGKKIHKKQMLFHKCKKRNRWVFGGNRSGKTQCGAVEAIWLARGIHPFRENKPNTEGWVVSLSQQVQRDVAQDKILYYLNPDWIVDIVMLNGRKDSPKSGVIDYILIKNVFGGVSKIGFKTCDQGREKFQGTSLDWVWFDEEPPFDIYLECRMRVLDKVGDIFGTMTPLKGLTWVYDKIYLNESNDAEVWYIEMEWADNPFLQKAEIDSLSSVLSPDELESRRFGKFSARGGLVYSEFDINTHVIEPFKVPTDWYDKISIDPGLHNPLSCHWYAVDYDGNVYVIAEHYEAEQTIEYHANKIKEICKKLGWKQNFNGFYDCLIDSAANQRTLSSPKSVSELFYDYGINVNTNVNKDMFSGISRVKSYLKNAKNEAKLFIFSNCVNMIREIKCYWWGNEDAPIKKDDHAMDDLRYYIMSRPENATLEKEKPTMIQIHKEKLLSRVRHNNLKRGGYY